jgi:hypothetical protein
MNSNLIKKLAGSSALLGLTLSASAQLPSGTAPPTAATPAGLNTGPDTVDAPWYPSPNGGSPIAVGQELFASGGPVYVTDLGPTGASFDESIFLASPNPADPLDYNNLFMDNHSTANGTTFYLGTFAAGTEIEFGLEITGNAPDVGTIYYDGPASRNPDDNVHAYMVNDYEGLANTTYVGFEDATDFNYIDEVYAFTGTTSAAPDASSTMPLLGMGVTALVCLARRFRK